VLEPTHGKNDDLCERQRRALGIALLSHAADELASSPRRARTLADRVATMSLDPRSEHYDETLLSRGVGIRFNGQEKTNVIEYSVSEGWIRVAAGRSRDRFGQPMTIKLNGQVEPYFETESPGEGEASEG
jgi:hypothetical protein